MLRIHFIGECAEDFLLEHRAIDMGGNLAQTCQIVK